MNRLTPFSAPDRVGAVTARSTAPAAGFAANRTMGYAGNIAMQGGHWVLTFPDLPPHVAVAETYGDLVDNAIYEVGAALCEYVGRLPPPRAPGMIRVTPPPGLMLRLYLVEELWQKLQAQGNQVWRVLGLSSYDDGSDWTQEDLLSAILEWPDVEVPRTLRQLGAYLEEPSRTS